MKDILKEIAQKTKERVEEQKKEKSFEQIKAEALALVNGKDVNKTQNGNKETQEFPFQRALQKDGVSLICEVKKASPSKGIIAEDFPYVEIAKDYEKGGASAISVLTEPYYFLGSNDYLVQIKQNVSLPIIRKDFIIDAYQIYETKLLGADACLLICSILNEETLKAYLELAHSLALSALVETHNDEEIEMALRVGARIIGVNNRNLRDFSVDISHSSELRKKVPDDIVFVAESGIKTKEQIEALKQEKVDAALIGETFMRAENRVEAVKEFAK